MSLQLLLGGKTFADKVGHQFEVLDKFGKPVIILDPTLDSSNLAQLLLGTFGILPEVRLKGLLLFVAEVYAFLVDVKDTSPAYPDALQPL